MPYLRWGSENAIKYFLLLLPHPGAISQMGAISRMITVFLELLSVAQYSCCTTIIIDVEYQRAVTAAATAAPAAASDGSAYHY